MLYHVTDNDDAIDRSYGSAPEVTPGASKCEICGTDRFVRVLRNGSQICLTCQDAMKGVE
jgi:hypothetical protein